MNHLLTDAWQSTLCVHIVKKKIIIFLLIQNHGGEIKEQAYDYPAKRMRAEALK